MFAKKLRSFGFHIDWLEGGTSTSATIKILM